MPKKKSPAMSIRKKPPAESAPSADRLLWLMRRKQDTERLLALLRQFDPGSQPMGINEMPDHVKDAVIVQLGGSTPNRVLPDRILAGAEGGRAAESAGSAVVRNTATQTEGIVNEFDQMLELIGMSLERLADRVMKLGGMPPPKEGSAASPEPDASTFVSALHLRLVRLRQHTSYLQHITSRVTELV
jgi:hypothetical protein